MAKKKKDAGDTATATQEGAQDTAPVLPMFYKNVTLLHADLHADLRVRPAADVRFAAEANSIVLGAAEIPQAAMSYPVVFAGQGEKISAYAVTGPAAGKNAFVNEEGKWKAGTYIPAYVRRYPFILVADKDKTNKSLAVDTSSDMLNTESGALIYEDGKPSDAVKGAVQFCVSFSNELEKSRVIFAQIEQTGILVERQAKVNLPGEEETRLTGFRVVDEQALNALNDETFLELRKTGALTLIYCHLWSMRSWRNILGDQSKSTPE